jgi:hypothetical protein
MQYKMIYAGTRRVKQIVYLQFKIWISKNMMKFIGLNKLHPGTLLLLIIFTLPVISCKGQFDTAPDSLGPKITIKHDTFDYGMIPRYSNPYRHITFTNTGKEPLMISVFGDVVSPVKYTKTPIEPGQSGEIKIHYPTARVGPFVNFIAINSNAFPRLKIIYVKGWVLHTETTDTTQVYK